METKKTNLNRKRPLTDLDILCEYHKFNRFDYNF